MRIGAVPYLNGKPLVWGLDREPGVELVHEVPSRLDSMLRQGEVAAGLVSSVACFMNRELRIVPGVSISCVGPAKSVKLFHNGKLESVKRVALDMNSLTGVLLAKIVLGERHGLEPEFVSMPPSLPDMLEACDAAVVIGDTTMCAPAGRWPDIDLGEEWHALTGLPLVFALWAVNPALATPDLADALLGAKARGLNALQEISEAEAARLGLPVETCFRYLSETMNYDLTEEHMRALTLFCEKARRYGLSVSQDKLELYEPSVSRRAR